ncbi:MAG TPA: hypothetical protein VKR27_07095 [Acidimicrobiales bacterium]|nr:hypothetical protein [Acidimicrobiales bacterium]
MSFESIRVPLEAEDAARLAAFRPEQREALVRTLTAVTRAYLHPRRSMDEILAESGARARAAGLTQQKLDELLSD